MIEKLDERGVPPVATGLVPPHGLAQIVAIFGNIDAYIQADGALNPRWQIDSLDYVALPVPLMLSFDHSKTITHFRCHKLLVDTFDSVFNEIARRKLESELSSFGGCFEFRPQRTGAKLSAHSWGIAIDLNSETNAQGTVGNMAPDLVEVFRSAGFEWGGDWSVISRDPMHFQFCTGY